MTLVSTVTVGSGGAASIEWSGIAGTGKDLLIVVSGRNSAGDQIALTLNSDTTNANYSRRLLTGYNGGVTSTSASARPTIRIVDNTQTASTFSNNLIYIPNYTSSVAKSILIDNVDEGNNAFVNTEIAAASWSGTSAITTVTLAILGGTIVQHSTASLYIIS
jgi:hypothetical protein